MTTTNPNPLASRAMLCVLRTGAWRASRFHRAESEAENSRHAVDDIARVNVRLTNHPALAAVVKLHAAARQDHYRLTLPSADDGLRLIPVGRVMEHSAMIQEYSVKHATLTAEFCAAYEAEKADAPRRLNGLYQARFFPELAVVESRFRFESDYLEVPAIGHWQAWLADAAEQAETELRERFAEALRHAVETLRQPDKVFRDSLVENLRDLCSLAGDLNLRDSIDIANVAQAAAADLCTVSPETLRENPTVRQQAAERAAQLCGMLGAP